MSDLRQLVSFFLDGQRYGVDIRVVREINPTLTLAPVPRAPSYIRGLVNIRGQVVPVVDVAVILGRPPRPIGDDSRIVIFKTRSELGRVRGLDAGSDAAIFGDEPVSFLVDSVADMVDLKAGDLKPTPGNVQEAHARFYHGVVRVEGELQLVLEPTALLGATQAHDRNGSHELQ